MKNIALYIVCFLNISVHAQNFEGTIKWSINTEVTDPAAKKKMEEAEKKMNDPQTQAQIKEMQEKMNEPQFKAMMEQNPQMKKQMEMMIAGVQAGGGMEAFMPKSFTIKLKNGNSLAKIEGGVMEGEILTLGNKDQSYAIKRDDKTYSVLPKASPDDKKPNVKVIKTGEKMKVLNYTCSKYVIESSDKGKTVTQNIWTTTDIKDIDSKYFSKSKFGGGNASIYHEGMEGVPMRVEMKTAEMNMVMEMSDIKKESLNAADFTIPSDFKETKGY